MAEVVFANLSLFERMCNKIACLVYSRTEGDKDVLSQILDSLNSVDYNVFHIKNERGVLLINQCCYLIPPEEVSLVIKAVNLFTSLISKGWITVEGKTLSLAVSWGMQCLKHSNEVEVLKYLQALARGNGKKIEEQSSQILLEFERLSNKYSLTPGSEEICLNYLRFIEAMTFLSVPKEEEALTSENICQYFRIFRDVLFREKNVDFHNDVIFCKFLITAMRGVGNLIQMSSEIITNHLGDILAVIKGYMLYGLLGYQNYTIQKLFPTSNTIPELLKSSNQFVKKLRGKYDKRSKKISLTSLNAVDKTDGSEIINDYIGFSENTNQTFDTPLFPFKTSDSDFSDSEHNQNTKVKFYEGKVRHCALILLGTVVQKTSPKVFIGYIPSFLPDGSQLQHMRTLITCLLEDPSPKCRSEVVRVLLMIISNSRQYFQQADGLSKSSFTAFSCTTSNIVKELHKSLLLTLQTEQSITTIKHILKCISDLIRCTPYHKIESGLLVQVAKNVKTFLKHKDINVQILALTVFGCIISIEPKVTEVSDIILMNKLEESNNSYLSRGSAVKIDNVILDDFEVYEEDDSETVKDKPWLFELCLINLMEKTNSVNSSTNVALQVESLQVIGALVRNFFRESVISFPNDVIELLKHCLSKSEYSIRLYSGKLMETLFNSLQFGFCQEDESKKPSITLAMLIWESLLPGPVTALIQNQDEPMLRYKQIMCVTLLFGCLRDESPAVRSSAARALAIFVLFPTLREDSLFFLDVIDATIASAKDEQTTVRTQASWLFGNLSEAIILNKEKTTEDDVLPKTIAELLKTGIDLAGNGPKTKPGAVRGIGNLLKAVDEEFLQKYKDLVVEGLDALIKNATTGTFMKARWNSCYAIANLLQNPLIHSNNEWMTKIFNVMINLIQHYKNFKVRISAGFVLTVPPTRESFGDLYNTIWSSVLNALENSKNISDFNEYQHRDQLVDQICLVMCHLVSLIEPEDLDTLQDVLYFHLDNLTHFMGKFHERLVPEKSNVLLNATGKIHSLLDERGLTVEGRNLVRVLQNLFVSDNLSICVH
ncbi:hypothetical protein RUM44_008848 [Polyplax serrata]|uniref:HEAT repeat-containing protein 6 n=1 Tax=Polyplax serrata TaxID=468196 RepID=A0ABR1BDE4_POLSC